MKLYRLLLRAFPRDVRRDFGAEMERMLAEQLLDARERGASRARLWAMAAVDAVSQGLAERLSRFERTTPSDRADARGWKWGMSAMLQDLRYARRLFTRQGATTTVAVLTLALGIGATTAVYSAVDRLLLRPLPYPDPHELVMVWEKRPAEGVFDNSVAPADFLDWERMNRVFTSMAAVLTSTVDLTGGGEPVRLQAAGVSTTFFGVLGIQPFLGRDFLPEEGVSGRHRVVVLDYELWRDRFGSDPSVVGRTILLSGVPHEVVGVLPQSFEFTDSTIQVWAPLPFKGQSQPFSRASHQYEVYARLKPGLDLAAARADMDRVGALLSETYPDTNDTHGAWVSPLADEVRQPLRAGLWLLLGASGFVLLIACVNVANLLLARSASRRREIAVRAAVGASRARIAGQMLTESVLLAIIGGMGGLLVAQLGIRLAPRIATSTLMLRDARGSAGAVLGLENIVLDVRVLTFAFVLCLVTGLLFGILPAWTLAGQDANESLKSSGRTAPGVRRRLRAALVVSEVAIAALLLVGAGLTWRSFHALLTTEPGFDAEGVLTALITLPRARYRGEERLVAGFEEIERRFAAIPGVRAAGATSMLPLGGIDGRRGIGIAGREPDASTPTRAHPRSVTPAYFRAMGIQLKDGRPFSAADDATSLRVAIVNETMARRYWPDASPVGRRFEIWDDGRYEVVGVIGDVRHWGLDREVNPEMYFPLAQRPTSFATFVLSTEGDPAALTPAVREQLRAVDPDLPLTGVRTMEQVAARSVESRAATMRLVAIFGLLALILAAAGIYGVMTHLVAMRSSEISVRLTLGANPADVMRMILREGAGQALVGLAIGLPAGILVMRAFRTALHGISPADPITLAAVGTVLLATALLACAVPARRAMRVDPAAALRQEL